MAWATAATAGRAFIRLARRASRQSISAPSSAIIKVVQAQLTARGVNVIIPTVSSGASSSEKKFANLKTAGYDVDVATMEVSSDNFAERMARRYIKTGRYIPEPIMKSGRQANRASYESLKVKADNFVEIDDNMGPTGTDKKPGYAPSWEKLFGKR